MEGRDTFARMLASLGAAMHEVRRSPDGTISVADNPDIQLAIILQKLDENIIEFLDRFPERRAAVAAVLGVMSRYFERTAA